MLQETISSLFSSVGLPQEYVTLALTALNKHSQNDILFDPNKVNNISEAQLKLCDAIFDWAELPFNTSSSMQEFKSSFFG